ncbi:type II toxin-antitoxin system VapC family toxin [Limnoglobus roseus]|uniref:Twitching motility protein PilT n=1 Tax=Limnoglobus roseus TaxID=2598579 RepID=A0A5C1A8P2_9BACT|nr:type II toxin-antitoxin system VapC family toxin [Limnoglobus roseus]QEL13458.1 twitching motility protein PilT [Limnoglobus roseus]
MNVLLDTHTLLWVYWNDPQLSSVAARNVLDPNNRILVSPASHWEVAIKMRIGKLTLREPFLDFVQHAIFDNGFTILPIEPRHTALLTTLPLHHKDPFDRLIVAQALVENMRLISADPALDAYGVQRCW